MKIKKLTIHNIASIENAEIDFAGGVLGNEPLFLITGETGSGKTTILNAICLALYNTAPCICSLKNVSDAAKIDGMPIDDSRLLMRRGTYDASVELVFDGNDGKEYVASWVAHRANKSGNHQKEKQFLTCLQEQITIQDKKREIAELIQSPNVVGLTYEQFCRTTMLAQGQFSKFVTSDDKEKSSILEKLTGTDLYSLIGEKVNDHFKNATDALAAITNRIEGAKLMEPEEREALKGMVCQLQKDLEAQQKSLDEITKKHEWLKSAESAEKTLKTTAEKRDAMKARLDDDQIREHGATVLLWDKTADIRTTLKGIREKGSQLAESKRRLVAKQTEFVTYVAGLEYVRSEDAAVTAEISRLQSLQDAESKHAGMYAKIQRIEALIDTIVSKRNAVKMLEDQIATLDKDKQTKAEPLAKANATVIEAQDALASAHKAVEEKKDAANGVNIEELRKVVKDYEKDCKLVEDCIVAAKNLRTKIQAKADADKTLAELKEQIEKSTQQKEAQEALLPDARRDAEALSNQLKGKMDLRSHLVELQARFHDTHTCPLCGSAVHGIHSESILDEEVAKAQELAIVAENRQKAIEKSIREAETELQTTQKPLERAIKVAHDAASDVENAKQSTTELLDKFQLGWDDDKLDEKLQRQKEVYAQSLVEAQQKMSDGQAKLDAIEPARREEDKKRVALDVAKSNLDQVKKSVEAIESKIGEAKTHRNLALKDEKEAVEALAPLLSIEVNLQNTDLAVLKNDVRRKAESYAQNADKILSSTQKSRELKRVIDSVAPTITELAGVLGSNPDVAAKEMVDLEKKLRTFNVEVTKLNGSTGTLNNQLKAEEDVADAFFKAHGDMDRCSVVALLDVQADVIQNYREEKRQIEDEIKQTEGAIRQIEGQLDELNRHKPALQAEDTLDALSDVKAEKEAQVKLLNNQKVEHETRLKDDAERAKGKAEDIQKKERLQHLVDNWKVLNEAFGGANGEKFKRVAQSYVLRSLLQKANYYLRMLNARYELMCTDGSLSINILDLAQGGAERNVSSLSGGEGFVVSLALALGLSAISKDKINVDTLFIDEGFGTLSADYLETVICTLDRLHQLGGRRVGIISHVAELANRISTQIQLKRTGPSSSKVEIVS